MLINNWVGWGFFDLCSFAAANPHAEVWETKPDAAQICRGWVPKALARMMLTTCHKGPESRLGDVVPAVLLCGFEVS